MTDELPTRCAVAQLKIEQMEKEVIKLWGEVQAIRASHTRTLVWAVGILISALGVLLANKL